jgi:hypothetical protein
MIFLHPIKKVKNSNGSYLYHFFATVFAVTDCFLKPWKIGTPSPKNQQTTKDKQTKQTITTY